MSDGSGVLQWDAIRRGGRLLMVLALAMAVLPGLLRAEDEADRRLREQIENRLQGQVSLHPKDLVVSVRDGFVQVTGSVAALQEVDLVDRLVLGIVGVREVDNRVTVRPSTRSDLAIRQEVRRLLDRFPALRWPSVDVAVAEGRVTLTGDVPEGIDKAEAERQARKVAGVTAVDNQVRPGAPPAPAAGADELETRVRSLLANPLTFGVVRDLRVETDGGTVYLYGKVPREADKEEAGRLVRALSGVDSVVNLIAADTP
jgi:hyperosmotically inducible periplasmic protein